MPHKDSQAVDKAKSYLRGESFSHEELDTLWSDLKGELEFGYASRVLAGFREGKRITGAAPLSRKQRDKLCQQHALCASKDPDTSAAVRHDQALEILDAYFPLTERDGEEITTDQEALGIAGGICKRKWRAFGQIEDLHRSLAYYERGYAQGVASDYGYTAINAAFINDLLAHLRDDSSRRRAAAQRIRQEIVQQVTPLRGQEGKHWLNQEWWYLTTLAEACFGLGDFEQARALLEEAIELPNTAYWEYETTTTQLVDLAWLLYEDRAAADEGVRSVLKVLTGSASGVDSVLVGKVGLALSGGGFRASLYHLGVLAWLAEIDVLRHVDVLSCVSGGSIVGAAYYLMLREMLSSHASLSAEDYTQLVQRLIKHFEACVSDSVRAQIQDGWLGLLKNLWDSHGGLRTDKLADKMDEVFYRPLVGLPDGPAMHQLNVEPADHDPGWRGQGAFNPKRHNWRRADKVPQLVLNATTLNTGHAWQFTTTWMGESPYAIHESVNSVSRLRRTWYLPPRREVTLGQAVAASAAVPGVFGPVCLPSLYLGEDGQTIDVYLADGGVYDNQGTVSLLAQDCNLLLVSDASGQLIANHQRPSGVKGRIGQATRSLGVFQERIRQANYADLEARVRSGQLRGLMFLHMKDDLDADPLEWIGSQETYQRTEWKALTRSGVRRDIQRRLAELRTDLNEFNEEERRLLMACGYQMAAKAFRDTLARIPGLSAEPTPARWVFEPELQELRSTGEKDRSALLGRLEAGSKVALDPD